MGKIKLYGGFEAPTSFLDKSSFRMREHDEDEMLFADKRSAHVDIQGNNFVYSGGELVSGTITAMQIYDKDGDIALSARNLNIKGDVFSYYYDRDGSWAFDYVYALGADTVIGSSDDDVMIGDGENDVLYGKGGDDYLFASIGTDTFHGGGGNDQFNFIYRKFDDAVIVDFDDLGAVQDILVVPKYMHRHMTVQQVGDDTVLHFRKHDVTLLDFKAEDINKADFNIINSVG